MKTIRLVGRDGLACALRAYACVVSHVRAILPRALPAFALASAALLSPLGAAQAQTPTTTQLISGPNPSVAGQPVTFSAIVSGSGGTPTGTVTFLDGGSPIGSGPLASNGQASFTIATLAVGSHTITTSYNGDSTFAGSNGGPITQIVNKNATNTLILSSLNPSTAGQSVTFNIVISPVTPTAATVVPTGTVNVFDNGNLIGSPTLSSVGGNSSAHVTTSALTAGSHSITMSYAGDANFTGNSNGSLTQQVNPPAAVNTSVTLSSSPANGSSFGQSVTFTATITAASGTTSPSGTVTFSDGITTIGSAPAVASAAGQSTATLTTSALPVGNLTITADYSGDSNFNPSSGSEPFFVNKANELTAITTTTPSITFGQSVTFVITVSPIPPNSGTPTGNVTVSAAGTPLVVTLSGGQASFTTSTLPVGADAILASYNGDNNLPLPAAPRLRNRSARQQRQ